MTTTTLTPEIRERLCAIGKRGFSSGLGDADSQVCIEAAIALAFGEPLSDTPACVAEPDRRWAIRLNDGPWSSPSARADALLPVALAQVGTAGTDREPWVARVVEGTIRRVVPAFLRHAAKRVPAHADALEAAAVRCEKDGDAEAARHAKRAAYAAAYAADAAAYAYAVVVADVVAYVYAADAYAAYAAAAAAAADAAAFTPEEKDALLRLAVSVGLDAYRAEGRCVEHDCECEGGAS